MSEIKKNWNIIKETVRKEYSLSDISYRTWIENLKIKNVTDDVVSIIIPSDQAQAMAYISKKFTDCFKVTITEMFDHEYSIKFVLESSVDDEDELGEQVEASLDKSANSVNYENAHLNPNYIFETFVVGRNNKFAHSACVAVAESPGEVYNPLFLYGGPGLGKTHLMHSIGHYILDNNPNMKVLYVTSEDFTNEVIESIRSGNAASMTKLREKYRNVDVLMVDDVQFIIGKDATQEEFFHTFNVLHSAKKAIILSSDKPPREMETLDNRFKSRFEWGLIADIGAPDFETRMAILRRKIESHNIKIDEEVINYIATNIKSNIRELEGAINKIIAYSKLNKVDISMQLAEEALKDVIDPNKPKKVTFDIILNVVADHFNIKKEDILSKKRNSDIVLPRQIVMYLCRNLTDMSLEGIGMSLGKKDHTTVIHGVNAITNQIEEDEELKNKIDTIKKKISPQ